MSSPSAIAANLACLLYLARHQPEDHPQLEEAVRVFLQSLAGQSLTVDATLEWLTINRARMPSSAPGVRDLNEQLLVHGVNRLVLPASPDPAGVLTLARTLSAYPGVFAGWDDMLASLGPTPVATLTPHGNDLTVVHLDEPARLEDSGEFLVLEARGDFPLDDEGLILPPIEDFPAVAPRVEPHRPPMPRKEDPSVLQQLLDRGHSSVDAGDYVALLEVAEDFLNAADRAVSEAASRMYQLELRRLLTRKHFAQFAKLAAIGKHRELATSVLRRLGSEATEVLMELLVETEAMAERRGYYSALTRMEAGADIIVHHLDHPTWYVVRNAAELCGEMRLKRSVPPLGRQVNHPDERVRKSVATALHRIGTREATEPLFRMLRDPSPAIRTLVLGHLSGPQARPLAMPLATLLETEEHPDVLRELLKALGRMGSPDALLALRRVAQGDVRRLGRRERLIAVEALGDCGEPAATLLRGLAGDADPDVAAAASRALDSTLV
ncbi:MAG TPA: HEAT repeat domain-containing protein [Gemmatimonadales bacterium]|nr:HEAT repeat domain-containing protein [Gemmatimonadales bacterium]